MPVITLPDGSERQFDNSVTVMQVAQAIGPGLAKATLGAEVDNQLVDASYLVEADTSLRIITDKDVEGLEIIRHSTSLSVKMRTALALLQERDPQLVVDGEMHADAALSEDAALSDGATLSDGCRRCRRHH